MDRESETSARGGVSFSRLPPVYVSTSKRLAPGLWFVLYLTGSALLFALGPIPYNVENPWQLYGFLAAAHILLLAGYCSAAFREVPTSLNPSSAKLPVVLIAVSAVLNVVLQIPMALLKTGGSLDLVASLRNPGEAYMRTFINEMSANAPLITYSRILASPLLFLTIPLTFFYWRRMGFLTRCLAASSIAVIWATGVVLGRNKAFADFFLLVAIFIAVHLVRSRSKFKALQLGVGVLIVVLLFTAFFLLFQAGGLGRMGNPFEAGFVHSIRSYMDYDNVFLRPVPDSLKPGVGHFYNYLTQGYQGLSYALRLDFVWAYGLGNSYFLHAVEERLLGTNFARSRCYPARIEQEVGYSMYSSWHTIYPWLASDFTFPGTLLIVFLVGRVLALSWLETLKGDNPFSVAVFATTCLMLFYFNANNQMLAFPTQFSSTAGLIPLWLVSRRYYRAKASRIYRLQGPFLSDVAPETRGLPITEGEPGR